MNVQEATQTAQKVVFLVEGETLRQIGLWFGGALTAITGAYVWVIRFFAGQMKADRKELTAAVRSLDSAVREFRDNESTEQRMHDLLASKQDSMIELQRETLAIVRALKPQGG